MQRSTNQEGSRELIASGQVSVHFRVLARICSKDLSRTKLLVCPADREKVAADNFDANFSDANVSYFLGLNGAEEAPASFLSGDRNLTVSQHPVGKGLFLLTTNTSLGWTKAIHRSRGNLLLSDGSVQFLDSSGLAKAAEGQEISTNLLAVP